MMYDFGSIISKLRPLQNPNNQVELKLCKKTLFSKLNKTQGKFKTCKIIVYNIFFKKNEEKTILFNFSNGYRIKEKLIVKEPFKKERMKQFRERHGVTVSIYACHSGIRVSDAGLQIGFQAFQIRSSISVRFEYQ